jgi:hypothetical protein
MLEVQSGRFLLPLDASPRPVEVRIDDSLAILDAGQAATLGANLDHDPATIDCLRGPCRVRLSPGREIVLPSGDSLQLPGGPQISLTSSELEAWRALCGDCDAGLRPEQRLRSAA